MSICGCVTAFNGGITNSGLIDATGVGISVAVATFNGNIVNTGTIRGGFAAIDLTGALNAITIDQNAGLIDGDIRLSPNGDTLNIRGGVINGNVVGPLASGTVNFALGSGGVFTYAAPFAMTGLSLVNFDSGTAFIDGSIQATVISVNNDWNNAYYGSKLLGFPWFPRVFPPRPMLRPSASSPCPARSACRRPIEASKKKPR